MTVKGNLWRGAATHSQTTKEPDPLVWSYRQNALDRESPDLFRKPGEGWRLSFGKLGNWL